MPGLYSLARGGVCSVGEARNMPIRVLTRLAQMLSDEYERKSQAAARRQGRERVDLTNRGESR